MVGRKGELNRNGGRCGRLAWHFHWYRGTRWGCVRRGERKGERRKLKKGGKRGREEGEGGRGEGFRLSNKPPGNSRAGYV